MKRLGHDVQLAGGKLQTGCLISALLKKKAPLCAAGPSRLRGLCAGDAGAVSVPEAAFISPEVTASGELCQFRPAEKPGCWRGGKVSTSFWAAGLREAQPRSVIAVGKLVIVFGELEHQLRGLRFCRARRKCAYLSRDAKGWVRNGIGKPRWSRPAAKLKWGQRIFDCE